MSQPENVKFSNPEETARHHGSGDENEIIVEFRAVDFSYDRIAVLENVDLAIRQRAFVSIIGPNGSGKTTLLKLMLGLLKPDRGEVLLFGNPPRTTRRKVGYTPQFLHVDFCFPVSVLDVVLMGRQHEGVRKFWYDKEDRQAARDALETVQLGELGNLSFRKLSGGQRQRVLIARALCAEPEMLLLDEPTSNIDPGSEERLYEILTELNKKLAILLVSHDIGFVSRRVSHVICVNRTVTTYPMSELSGTMIRDIYT